MKNKIIGCLVALFFFSVFADEKADSLLGQLQLNYQNSRFISAHFQQEKQVKFISKKLISRGQFHFANQVGLNWQIDTPFFARTLFLPTGVFKINAAGMRSEEKDQATLIAANFLQSLFSGQWQELRNKFAIEKAMVETDGKWQVSLKANDKWVKKAIQSITLSGRSKRVDDEVAIEEIHLLDAKNNATTIHLSHIEQQTTPLTRKQRQIFSVADSE